MQQKTRNWPLILVLCCTLFPLGIWLMVKKILAEPYRLTANGKVVRTFGFVLIGMVAFLFLAPLTGAVSEEAAAIESETYVGAGVMLAGGVVAVWQGARLTQRGRRFTRYEAMIRTEGERSLARLAAGHTTEEIAAVDLQIMIDRGLLPGGYVDRKARRLVLPEAPAAPKRAVTCPHCGGVTHVAEGIAATCDYCGSPLTY